MPNYIPANSVRNGNQSGGVCVCLRVCVCVCVCFLERESDLGLVPFPHDAHLLSVTELKV